MPPVQSLLRIKVGYFCCVYTNYTIIFGVFTNINSDYFVERNFTRVRTPESENQWPSKILAVTNRLNREEGGWVH